MAKNRSRNRTRLTRRATRNVELQNLPQTDQLQRQLQQAQEDYLKSMQASQAVYGGYQDTLGELPRPQFDRIGNEFNDALSTVQSMFGGENAAPYMAPGEAGAGMNLGQAFGEAGQTMLANMAGREGMYRSSAAREGALAERGAGDTLMQNFQDTLQGYNDQLSNIQSQAPYQISAEMDRLKEQALQAKLAQSKMKSDAAMAEWLRNYLGGSSSPRNPGGNDGGGGNGGGGGPDRPGGGNGPNAGPGTFGGAGAHQHTSPYDVPIGGATGGMDVGNNGPWVSRAHPIADYTHGRLAKSLYDLAPERRRYISNRIENYAQTHPDAFPRPDSAGVHGPWNPALLSPRELIRNVERRYYR
jgi:hypothetical protein